MGHEGKGKRPSEEQVAAVPVPVAAGMAEGEHRVNKVGLKLAAARRPRPRLPEASDVETG